MAILCQCEAISERKVRKAIERGAASVEEIGELCRAGTRCGGCHPHLEALLCEAPAAVPYPVLRPAM